MGTAARVLVALVFGFAVSACGGSEALSLGGTSSACNRYSEGYTVSGGYTVDGSELTFGALATTRMACPDRIMAQEAAYLAALEASWSFTLEDGRLVIEAGDGTLTYAAA